MRPLRLICTVSFFFIIGCCIFLSLIQPIPKDSDGSRNQHNGFRSRWSFGAPASFFPPSAIISLTDDNTTFFLSRPALYGPLLSADGMTAQLWVGSGFGDDTLVRGGMVAVGQTELGCSDIPGWTEDRAHSSALANDALKFGGSRHRLNGAGQGSDQTSKSGTHDHMPEEDDDTDNFLHFPLHGGPVLKDNRQESGNVPAEHADIQSLQESAEIHGKVVLLSRGGCGFLEKTKWVQRRGGIALIVGDYTRGGHLIQMSTNDDASNITIPSIFTAYTSAHLLSSLVPSKSSSDSGDNEKSRKQQNSGSSKPAFTTSAASPKATKLTRLAPVSKLAVKPVETMERSEYHAGWFGSIANKFGLGRRTSDSKDSRRPPSSGTISWVQSQTWDDEKVGKTGAGNGESVVKKKPTSSTSTAKDEDDFVIGVHDWRDPDMVQHSKGKQSDQKVDIKSSSKSSGEKQSAEGSRAPASGIYVTSQQESGKKDIAEADEKSSQPTSKSGEKGWLKTITESGKDNESPIDDNQKAQDMYKSKIAPHFVQDQEFEDEKRKKAYEHDGLWITITPTNVSASPLFDTLLVLVVSPLVTLSVVYALLLLRSRIRRRRWRAPRSVVDRLPVRTYQTMSCSSSNSGSQLVTPQISSPTTPLLTSTITRSRPRSATVSSIRQDASASLERVSAHLSSREKPAAGNAFKRKYKGRQVECVVCLEEYVDGQSQVMSLPCGHEFHAECITPWLTTRRRTCPICKGDVVRSMDQTMSPSSLSSRSTSSSYTSLVLLAEPPSPQVQSPIRANQSHTVRATVVTSTVVTPPSNPQPPPSPPAQRQRPSPITHASDPSLQAAIAETRNDNPSSAIPIPMPNSTHEDLAATLVGSRQFGDGILTPPEHSQTVLESIPAAQSDDNAAFGRRSRG